MARELDELVKEMHNARGAVYLACEEPVAKEIATLLGEASEFLKKQRSLIVDMELERRDAIVAYKVSGHDDKGRQVKKRVYATREDYNKYGPNMIKSYGAYYDSVKVSVKVGGKWKEVTDTRRTE